MIPSFFGDADRQLFGVYHPPAGTSARRAGVVLCYPAPQEYRQVHWAYRRLATLLSDAGFHVLRFDYYATGDSAGGSGEGRLGQWQDDVRTAVRELRDVAGVRSTSLVGMRLGAALAARATAAGLDVADLVCWDPVVRGTSYLAGLDAEHAAGLRSRRYPQDDHSAPDELLGFELPPALREEIAAVDLTAEGCGRPGRVLIAAAVDDQEYADLADALAARGLACERRHVPDATLARGGHSANDVLVPRAVLGAVAAFLAGS